MASFFKIACPQCSKPLKVSQDLAGQSRKCPYCHAAVKIPDVAVQPPAGGMPNIVVTPNAAAPAGPSSSSTPPPRPEPVRRRKKSMFQAGSGESASSDVSLVGSGIIGTVLAVVWLVAVLPLRGFQFGQLFWDRGMVPFATTFLMFWSVAILILKWKNLKQQKEAMLLDVLPTEVAEEITIGSLDGFVNNIRGLPASSAQSFLTNRVLRGIEHFRVRKSAAETVTMMESQSAIDANNVAGSYSVLKVFIWALPILGFIGTVVGVSGAVAGLASSLDGAGDISGMKDSLNGVFGGLGTAFDTTLLALIMSMVVKIPASALQKSEEDLITAVDEYCNENLLRRLNDGREGGAERGAGGGGPDATVFREAVEAAMGTHHAELEQWLTRLDAIGGKLTTQVSEGWDKVNSRIQQQQQQHVTQLQQQQSEQQKSLQAQLQQMATSAAEIQTMLGNVGTQAATMQNNVTGSFNSAQTTLQQQFAGLQNGLNGLSTVLQKLGEQSVVIQQVQAPKKRGWFSKAR
jgi:hypothetical protein